MMSAEDVAEDAVEDSPTETVADDFGNPFTNGQVPEGEVTKDLDELDLGDSSKAPMVPVAAMFSTEEEKSFSSWMKGEVSEPPAFLRQLTSNFATRAGWAMAFQVAESLTRQSHLTEFIRQAEARMFDTANLANFPAYGEEIQKIYSLAAKSRSNELEFTRKFILQHREIMDMTSNSDPNPDVTEIVNLLSDLPADRLAALKKVLLEEFPVES